MPGEELLIGLHQVALADGGQHLAERHAPAVAADPQAMASGSDGAGSDQQHGSALPVQARYLAHQRRHDLQIQPVGARGEHIGANLGDDAAVAEPFL